MKQKIHFWASIFTFSMIFFYSCQKTQDIIENKQISSLKMKAIIDSWKEEYIRGASNKNQKKLEKILDQLNYENVRVINKWDKTDLYLVQIKVTNEGFSEKFMAFKLQNQQYILDGIYNATDLKQIELLLTTKKLPLGKSIVVTDINDYPIKAWECSKKGKMLYKVAYKIERESSQKKSSKKETDGIISLLLPIEEPGEPGPCIDWYWVTWDLDTGQILSENYLYSTGDCGQSGLGTTGPSADPCMQNAQEAVDNLSDAQETSEDAGETITEIDPFKKQIDKKWTCLRGIGWVLFSIEKGFIELYDVPNNKWKWISLTHQSIVKNGISLGGSVTPQNSATIATPHVYDNYSSMEISFDVEYAPAYNCPVVNIALPPYTLNYHSTSQLWQPKSQ